MSSITRRPPGRRTRCASASARGTHLAALVEVDTPGQPFLAALGFRERGQRRTLMIRRAG